MKQHLLYLLPALIFTFFSLTRATQAQICDDWKAQSTAYVVTGSTPADPGYYQWEEKDNNIQGVHLCVLNADVIPVYIQQGNNYINFTSRFSPSSALLYMVHIEVNIDDNGYTEIYSGSAKQDIVWYGSSASFPETGEYDLKVRVVFFDGTIRFRQYKVSVIPASQKLYKDNAGNTLRKWQGNDPGGLNAIVFSEGFDAYNTNPQEMYYAAADDLIECLRDNGYDVFLLDNYFGTQDIRNNAAIFASAVQYISSVYGNELIVAGGVSMGGIISRYAMAKAEQDGDPLPVHTFIAIDSPHQGAVISEPLQNFKKANEADDEFAKHALSNVAARQLLVYNAYDPGGAVHDAFYQELNSLNGDGYPHLTRNIGVSFSTDEPNPNTGGWYKITYHTGPFNGTVKTFDLTEAEMQAGSWLPRDLTTMSPIIKQASYWWLQLLVPGITPLYYPTIEFERFTDPAYIPYPSALDIRNGHSMFDVCVEPAGTSWHDVLPVDILGDIVNEVILTDTYFQNKHVIGNWNLRGEKVAAGNFVTSLIPYGDVRVYQGAKLHINVSKVAMLRPGFYAFRGCEMNITADPGLHYDCDNKLTPAGPDSPAEKEKVIINNALSNRLVASIFPNPATDRIQIQLGGDESGSITVEIFNNVSEFITGGFFPAGTEPVMNISQLAKGVYIVRISNGMRSASCRLVKI
jgi:hypothetical protein